jgi:hypothetical protein
MCTSERKSNGSKDSIMTNQSRLLDHFPKNHMKIVLGELKEKQGKEDIFKSTIGKENYIEILMIVLIKQ